MKIKQITGKILYKVIGSVLPDSSQSRCYRKIRATFGRMIIKECGINPNFGKEARFSNTVSLGDNSGIGNRAFLQGTVQIGKNVMMAEDVKIFTVNHETSSTAIPMCEQGSQKERPVVIGNDVWIGSNVLILPGSVIGNGVILGAGCVVRGNIPDYAVVIGNPAQIIKYRNRGIADETSINYQ